MSTMLTGRERDLLYRVARDRLTGIDDVWKAIQEGDWRKAQRLGREYSDLLRLLVDDLGWGDDREEEVELTCPPDVLQNALEALRREAGEEDREQRELRLHVAETQLDRDDAVAACENVLEKLASNDVAQTLEPASDDARAQATVLKHVLWEHPHQLREQDLQRELAHEELLPAKAIQDSVERLMRAGLLHRQGGFVLPTPQALHLHHLRESG